MNSAPSTCKVFTLPLSAILFLSIALSPSTRVISAAENQTVDCLQLLLVPDSTPPVAGKPPGFIVELRNTGKEDLVLNLGMMLANDRKQYPRAIVLILTDSEGKSRIFDLREPFAIAGRLDPMVVPLPKGATFSLPIDLDNYWSAASKEFEYKFKGSYSIEAKFMGEKVPAQQDLLLAPYWIGEVTSNRLTFHLSN
jgi:hypothetical protein